MTDDLLSLRAIVVSGSEGDRDLFRQAAAASHVPIEVIEANGAPAACRSLGGGVDLVFLDAALDDEAVAQVMSAARKGEKPAFTILLAETGVTTFQTDALAAKPLQIEETKRLLDGAIRTRLPNRVLVVDDSATMRMIVRKILAATRFAFQITDVGQGIEAIELARKVDFDIVILDYNMPGFSGLETMAEFRRENRRMDFVLMTSTQDSAIANRALAQGAAFLKKPFFPADMEAVLCSLYGLQALNPNRA